MIMSLVAVTVYAEAEHFKAIKDLLVEDLVLIIKENKLS